MRNFVTKSMMASAGALALATAFAGAPAMANPAAAAAVQNIVTGRVTDETGAALPGARVVVREHGVSVATDRQGRFYFGSLPAGAATLEIEYLGLPSQVRTIQVAAGDVAVADVIIDRNAFTGDEVAEVVVVGSITDGVARAMNQQRTADNTTNVVSADAIGRFPDHNIAEALQRVPGIGVERDQGEGNFISLRGAPSEFTSITVDGVGLPSTSSDTRAVDVGALPADVVTALEVSKSLLPWQDSDSIAGSVNLVTRSPFDRPRLHGNVNVGGSYNEMGGTNDYRVSGVISNVFGAQNQFGALLSASLAQTDRRVDNIESVWTEEDGVFVVEEQLFKDYETRRERVSLTGAFEYRPTATDRFFLRGTYGRRTDDEFRNLFGILYADGDLAAGATDTRATWEDVRFTREFRHRIKRDESWVIAAGGEHEFTGFSVDYTLSQANSEESYPGRRQLLYRTGTNYDVTYDFSADADNPVISVFQTGEHRNAANYGFREHVDRWATTTQEETAASVNFTVPTTLFSQPAEWRFGAKARQRDVNSDEERYRSRASTSSPGSLASMLSNEVSRNYDYDLGFKFDDSLVRQYFRSQRDATVVSANRLIENSLSSDYGVSEDIYAAYAAARIQFDRANLILGLRVENTQFEGWGYEYDASSAGNASAYVRKDLSHDYTDWFPNATLRYAFSDDLIGRVALSRGIARPRYRDAIPRATLEQDGGGLWSIERGNPDLKPTLSNNVDASLEYYFRPLGVVSGGVFYKDLTDYVFTLSTLGDHGGVPATITQSQNAEDGRIYGFEFNYQQQFAFLPGFLSGFGVAANYTWTDAEMTLPGTLSGRGNKVVLPNHSDTTVNLSVFYETSRFNARLSWTDRSDFVQEFAEDPSLDLYWEGRSQLDLTASFDVTERVNVYLEAKNLTNSEGIRYYGSRSRVYEREQFGYLLFGGVRVNF